MSVAVNPRTDGGKKTGKRASAEGALAALAVRWESITSLHVLWLEPGEQVCSPATTTQIHFSTYGNGQPINGVHLAVPRTLPWPLLLLLLQSYCM